MGEGINQLHQGIQRNDVVVILSGLGWQLQLPAFHDLLVAEVAEGRYCEAEEPMPDGYLFADEVEAIEEDDPGDECVGAPG